MKLKSKFSSIQTILDNMGKDHINEFSAQCAYYVILSFIPFIILLLTLIQYTNIEQQQLFNIISRIIPSSMNEMVLGIVKEVYSKSVGTVSISLIFTLLSADRGLFALVKGLHSVYNYSDNKKKSMIYLKLTSILKTIIFIVLVAMAAVILVFGNPIISTIKEKFGLLENYTIFSQFIAQIVFMVVAFVVFLCLYKFIPGYKITFKSQVPGAIFSSIALVVVSFVFSKYLYIFKGFSITYGSLTALMLIMMWTYTCFYVIFLGAEINKFYSMKKDTKQSEGIERR